VKFGKPRNLDLPQAGILLIKHLTFIRLLLCSTFGLLVFSASGQVYFGNALDGRLSVSAPKYLIDDSGVKPFREIRTAAFHHTPEAATEALLKLNRGRNIWAHLTVTYADSIAEPIGIQVPRFTKAVVYFVHQATVDSIAVSLDYLQYNQKSAKRPFIAQMPALPEGSQVEVYIKITSYSRIHTINDFWYYFDSLASFDSQEADDSDETTQGAYTYIFFCGFLLFQLAYVLLQWYFVRRRVYVNYAAYILCVFLYYYGRFSAFINQIPELSSLTFDDVLLINNSLLILPSYFYFRFARFFVDLKATDPKLNKIFKYYERFLLAAFVVELAVRLTPNDLPKSWLLVLVLISQLPVAVYTIIRLARQRRAIAWFLIAGSSAALLTHIVANFMPVLFTWLLPYIAPLTVTMIGILIEIGIFNTGLLFKARDAEVKKIQAQQAYIDENRSRQDLQEEFASVRNKLASDLHDDIGSSLSSIRIYSYAAKQKLAAAETDQTSLLLGNIERSSETMLNTMSDMVWAMNPDNDSNEKLIERIKSFAFEILAACDAVFEVQNDPAFPVFPLNQAQRKNILLIFKEAINNTAKYSGASVVRLQISSTASGGFQFAFRDNGRGLPQPIPDGNGMRTMRERVKELGSTLHMESDEGGMGIWFEIQ